jgi:putative transposase
MIRPNFLWHAEISEPGDSRNAIDGLNHAFRKFFTYLKAGKKPDFPRSKKKDVKGSFELREKPKLR